MLTGVFNSRAPSGAEPSARTAAQPVAMPPPPPEEMEWAGLEVTEADTAPQHPASFAKMVGLDVCVLAEGAASRRVQTAPSATACTATLGIDASNDRGLVRTETTPVANGAASRLISRGRRCADVKKIEHVCKYRALDVEIDRRIRRE